MVDSSDQLPTLNPDSILIFAPPLLDSTDSFSPTDVTVSRRKGSEPVFIFVADGYNSKIFKFDPSGEVVGEWGGVGDDSGLFRVPVSIDIDYDGYLYVVDSGNHRVQVFDTSGAFVRSWGGYGSAPGQFKDPVDLALGFYPRNTIVEFVAVSDHGNNRVQLFNRNGQLLKVVSSVPHPLGLSVPRSGIHVISKSPNRIIVIDASNLNSAYVIRSDDLPDVVVDPYGIYNDEILSPFVSDRATHKVWWFISAYSM